MGLYSSVYVFVVGLFDWRHRLWHHYVRVVSRWNGLTHNRFAYTNWLLYVASRRHLLVIWLLHTRLHRLHHWLHHWLCRGLNHRWSHWLHHRLLHRSALSLQLLLLLLQELIFLSKFLNLLIFFETLVLLFEFFNFGILLVHRASWLVDGGSTMCQHGQRMFWLDLYDFFNLAKLTEVPLPLILFFLLLLGQELFVPFTVHKLGTGK